MIVNERAHFNYPVVRLRIHAGAFPVTAERISAIDHYVVVVAGVST